MISFKDYEDEKGRINWDAYHKAQVDDGERCEQCGEYLILGKGYRRTCNACNELTSKSAEVDHKKFLRCPKCGHLENVHDDHYGLFEDGEHEVFCNSCDHKYTITTHVSFEFTSPPRIPEEPEEEEVEEDDDEAVDDETEGST